MSTAYRYTLADASMRDTALRPYEIAVRDDTDNGADMQAIDHVRRIIGLPGSYKFGAWREGSPDTAPVLFSAKPGDEWLEITEVTCVVEHTESTP